MGVFVVFFLFLANRTNELKMIGNGKSVLVVDVSSGLDAGLLVAANLSVEFGGFWWSFVEVRKSPEHFGDERVGGPLIGHLGFPPGREKGPVELEGRQWTAYSVLVDGAGAEGERGGAFRTRMAGAFLGRPEFVAGSANSEDPRRTHRPGDDNHQHQTHR